MEQKGEGAVISQSWQLFPPSVAISELKLVRPKNRSLLVVTNTESVLMPVANCGEYKSCSRCLRMRDPHCGWDLDSESCIEKYPENGNKNVDEQFVQDLKSGDTSLCPTRGSKKCLNIYNLLIVNLDFVSYLYRLLPL